MKKVWFSNLALTLGLLVCSPVSGQQYQNGYSNYGPSSFPVQISAPNQQLAVPQSILQNVPQVPYQNQSVSNVGFQQVPATPYQFVSTQEQISGYGAAPTQHVPTSPLPMYAPQPSAVTSLPGPHSHTHSAPLAAPGIDYGQQQVLAPGCTTCGPAPFTQPNYGYSSNCNSCPAPVAYNAPSVFNGGFAQGHGGGFGNQFGGGQGQLFNGLPSGAKPWFFGGGFLRYNRIDDHKRQLSLRDSNNMNVLNTGDAQMNAMNGFEIMGGRYFNCGKNAIQASYWGLFPDSEMVTISEPGGAYRSRILGTGDVFLNVAPDGMPSPNYDAYAWYDGAVAHRLERSSEYHNVEVNLLGFAVGHAARNFNRATGGTMFSGTRGSNCGYCGGAGCGACGSSGACGTGSCGPTYGGGANCAPTRYATGPTGYVSPACGSRLNLNWLAGFRYFSFDDNLQYAADYNGDGITRAVDDFYYDVNTTNDLVGFQVGGRGDYCVGRRANLFATGKVGVYNNRATLMSRMGTDSVLAYEAGMPSATYSISETDNRVAFLSEFGTGVGFRVSPKWTATFGYSVLVASGVATSPGNVRGRGDFVADQRYINNQDSLILHGFNLGALYNF